MNTQLLKATTEGIHEAARLLRDGRLVAIPTETVYGLAADALNPKAVASIFAAKERPMDNPLIVHIADINDWASLVKGIPDNARRLAEAYWPGPLTIILPAADHIPNEVRGGLSTVAVRFPADPVAQAVILHSGCPLAAPSAIFGCQFIIATHSPFLLSMRGAKIYDLDADPVQTSRWTQLPAVRAYYDFFHRHAAAFSQADQD